MWAQQYGMHENDREKTHVYWTWSGSRPRSFRFVLLMRVCPCLCPWRTLITLPRLSLAKVMNAFVPKPCKSSPFAFSLLLDVSVYAMVNRVSSNVSLRPLVFFLGGNCTEKFMAHIISSNDLVDVAIQAQKRVWKHSGCHDMQRFTCRLILIALFALTKQCRVMRFLHQARFLAVKFILRFQICKPLSLSKMQQIMKFEQSNTGLELARLILATHVHTTASAVIMMIRYKSGLSQKLSNFMRRHSCIMQSYDNTNTCLLNNNDILTHLAILIIQSMSEFHFARHSTERSLTAVSRSTHRHPHKRCIWQILVWRGCLLAMLCQLALWISSHPDHCMCWRLRLVSQSFHLAW